MTPLARFLAIAFAAPLLVLNALAVSAIFDYFHSLIVILVAASLIAFLLNYPVSWMERQGAQREQVAIWLMLRFSSRKSVRLPGFSRLAERLLGKH